MRKAFVPKSHSLWLFLKARLALMAALSLSLGCGDCAQISDFVDITDASFDVGSGDTDTLPDDAENPNDTNNQPDTGEEKDFGPLFDFGFDDTDVQPGPFELRAVVPDTGPVGGGTQVRIDGDGFEDGATVFFGSQSVPATLTRGRLVARTPAGTGPGPVSVRVINPDGESRVLVDAFRYVTGLNIANISPTRIPTSGGVEVEIQGEGFEPDAAVSFSGQAALRVSYLNENKLRVLAPARPRGYADVRVTTRYATALAPRAVVYFVPLTLTDITPASGPTTGGNTVVLRGEGFDSTLRVWFGATPAEVINVNVVQQAAQVKTPANAPGLVDVRLQTDFDATNRANAYLYTSDSTPVLAAISPNVGPQSGGTDVLLIGQGLDAPTAAFRFGATNATIVAATPTSALVKTPPGTGNVDVTFLVNNAAVTSLPGAFTYVANLELSDITPGQGDVAGGTLVTLTGSGLANADVTVDSIPAEVVSASDTTVVIRTPAHSAGTADVTVSRDGMSQTLDDAFTYTETLEVWGFSPVRGSVAGGTFVEVRGRGFDGALTANLDGIPATDVRRVDRNNLTLRTPPHNEGDVALVVTTPAGTATGPYTYNYFNPAGRFGGATGGPVNGAVNVTVYSLDGGPLENAFVMLSTRGDTPYQGLTDANGMITLSGADVLGPQTTTATRAGYSTATLQTVDAENITLFLTLLDPPPNPGGGTFPPSAAIYGDISATGKLSDPDDENTYDLAIVGTTTRTPFGGNPAAGPNAIVLGEGRYEINARIGDMAIVGLCGEYNSVSKVFTPKLMAVKRFVYANDLDRLRHDLVCDIPLDQTLTFKLTNTDYAPTGPNNNRVEVIWDFGFEGFFQSPIPGVSLSDLVTVPNQPTPEGAIADLKFIAVGGSYTNQGAPFSRAFTESFDFTTSVVAIPPLLDVPLMTSPAPGGLATGGAIRFEGGGPYYPDLFYLTLRNDLGIPVWQWIVPGDQNFALLPEFPDFSALPPDLRPNPYPAGQFYLSIFAARTTPGFVFETVSYREIRSEAWSAYSLFPSTIQLR